MNPEENEFESVSRDKIDTTPPDVGDGGTLEGAERIALLKKWSKGRSAMSIRVDLPKPFDLPNGERFVTAFLIYEDQPENIFHLDSGNVIDHNPHSEVFKRFQGAGQFWEGHDLTIEFRKIDTDPTKFAVSLDLYDDGDYMTIGYIGNHHEHSGSKEASQSDPGSFTASQRLTHERAAKYGGDPDHGEDVNHAEMKKRAAFVDSLLQVFDGSRRTDVSFEEASFHL